MATNEERVDVRTAVAVRGDTGFFFGTLRWIEPNRLLVEVDAELEGGDELDVRVTLTPTPATALLRAVVARALVIARGESPRYVLDITGIAPAERHLLDEWTRNVRNKGTFSRFDTVISTHGNPSGERGQSNADVRLALERMSRRPGGPGSLGPQTDPFGARSDIQTGSSNGAGRGAVRDALRSAIARGTVGRGTPTPGTPTPSAPTPSAPTPGTRTPSTPPPSTLRSGGSGSSSGWPGPPARSTPSTASTPGSPRSNDLYTDRGGPGRVVAIGGTNPGFPAPQGTRPGTDPTYATTQTRTAHWMEVRWHNPADFDRDCRLQLCNYILVLQRGAEPLPDREPLRIVVRHGDLQLDCEARIKAQSTQVTTYRLMFDALQIERLEQWTIDYGRK
ncbi:MAG: hypothetical protein Q8P41_27810 [Pseudomonadota bacterium]|nr:hypothetical protein [Pseudomonadota bacterium]